MNRIALLLLFPLAVIAADELENETITVKQDGSAREQVDRAQRLLSIAYNSDQVRSQCLKTPDEHLDVALNGYTIPVNCMIWNRWYAAEQERLRQEAEAAP